MVVFVLAAAAANWLTSTYGFVPVGFGLTVTAGTYAAGVALVARDFIHDWAGLWGVAAAIAIGGAVSYLVADAFIATASLVAFAFSEAADTLVYAPLRHRHWSAAVIASSVAGAIVDTAIFLGIAFGAAAITWNTMAGQLVGKVLWVAIPVAVTGGLIRRNRAPAEA